MAAGAYSFPVLGERDLLACARELGLPLARDQLLKPSPEAARRLYEALVVLLMGVRRCALPRPPSPGLAAAPAPAPEAGGAES